MPNLINSAEKAATLGFLCYTLYLEFMKKNRKGAMCLGGITIAIFLFLVAYEKWGKDERAVIVTKNTKTESATPKDYPKAPAKQDQFAPRKEENLRGQITILSPENGAEDVEQRPPVELTYVNIPSDQILWLIVFGDSKNSQPHQYWPLGRLGADGRARSVIDRVYDKGRHFWRSQVLDENAWFQDPHKKYRLEAIAVNAVDDASLRAVFQHEADTNQYQGEDERRIPLHPKAQDTVHVTRGP